MTDKQKSYLSGLNIKQLDRIYTRCGDYIGNGGIYGWDWPTLRMLHPHIYEIKRTILRILADRTKDNVESA